MRLFIALELPDEIKTALRALQTELRQTRAAVGWTKPENLHLTLRFLGEIETTRLSALKTICVDVAQQFAPFTLELNGIGFFPTARKPKVIWAGLADPTQSLPRLHNELEEHLAAQDFGREEKAFHPHLTLGRVKTADNLKLLCERALAYRLPALSFNATQLVLMQSQLDPGGSIYTPLARARFSAQQSLSDNSRGVLE